ncbi:flagellar hook protein [Bradyrhizobium jicamae]|uniref:flagellin N-terminal helical domain-containing protein n=1 Tax=Bradyrhizobium jicamae TaxID=280332 RepID=UPI001BAC9910|nr:flagellin [Bradyrhizobium jicamae]MBR0755054.1 flagellar hook protein [Bradyrhizobium jicamae]
MSGIVLSSSVRQNLLSLQSTADLLATTQNRLATGKKVNTALDNPTNFFTAASLDNRASDINNLLDGIGNGVQVLQAANTGITSLQKLVDSAKSVANQALQAAVGYSQKSSVTTGAIAGATTDNLLGSGAGYTDATFVGSAATGATRSAYTSTSTTGSVALQDNAGTPAAVTASTSLDAAAANHLDTAVLTALSGKTLTLANGNTIVFNAAATATTTAGTVTTIGLGAGTTSTVGDITTSIAAAAGTGVTSGIDGTGHITLSTGTTSDITFGTDANSTAILSALGIASSSRGGNTATTTALVGTTLLQGVATQSNSVLSSQFAAGDSIAVDGKSIVFYDSGVGGSAGSAANTQYLDLATANVSSLLTAIDTASGATGSGIAAGAITLHTGTNYGSLNITSTNTAALAALGLPASGVSQPAGGTPSGLTGKTLTIAATGNGTATNITFGNGVGQVKSLNDLNNALAGNNLQATLSSTGALTITTTNDAASATIGAIGGTAAAVGNVFAGLAGAAPVQDPTALSNRANLVDQYNNILDQITTTAQDASYNGINLLNGDQLKLTFNETGTSTLKIQGVTFNAAGLQLSKLTAGTDFLDNTSANTAIKALNAASGTLRSQASTLGSNLSIVQIRQDFSKNLINVLQTGSSNLTLADTNEEAANSQALSTRQSIAVSALALANQSQQSVLQLLR